MEKLNFQSKVLTREEMKKVLGGSDDCTCIVNNAQMCIFTAGCAYNADNGTCHAYANE